MAPDVPTDYPVLNILQRFWGALCDQKLPGTFKGMYILSGYLSYRVFDSDIKLPGGQNALLAINR